MSDNPFSEPDDDERTVLRRAGGTPPPAVPTPPRAAAAPMPATAQRLAGEADALPKVGKSPMAAAAAPLLDLLARIGAGAQATQVSNAEELRDRAVRALQAFEADCRAASVPDEQLRAAHYALCAALDDTALATPWGQSSSWAARSLSSTFHQDVRSGERFFDLLSGMQKEPGRYLPALEICYLCLSLGLRGRYRLDSRGTGELERIREGLYQLLSKVNGAWERELSPHWRGVDAPHRGPARNVPPWVAAAIVLFLLAVGYIVASNWVNSRGDALQQRVVQLPPAKPPLITREAAPVPPAPVAPAADDGVSKLRKFLAPEIAEGLVVVEGDLQRLMIRIMARGMFESGSSELQPRFVLLLNRIGEALRSEPGRVMVLGHSDNQPIRTVRFPSNFQLSAARAESAKAILVSATAQAERFSSAGRADTEPLAANDTPEGREKNRRIEIVLSRGEGR
ncbi:type VI secretion system protein TssL, long form [Aquabacterium sp.]|uniref:type VI secretion system protein TssL, long form n=1 Tax=Aquabacterium sp. TaxID=1872578 RepID=UPI002C4FB93F|nr:type VI secretion system protein TssL, long form [Aquabacterium sp.]HSW03528.1 type VI secretion system protein TssL, long form [Aquabacterium sp.]